MRGEEMFLDLVLGPRHARPEEIEEEDRRRPQDRLAVLVAEDAIEGGVRGGPDPQEDCPVPAFRRRRYS